MKIPRLVLFTFTLFQLLFFHQVQSMTLEEKISLLEEDQTPSEPNCSPQENPSSLANLKRELLEIRQAMGSLFPHRDLDTDTKEQWKRLSQTFQDKKAELQNELDIWKKGQKQGQDENPLDLWTSSEISLDELLLSFSSPESIFIIPPELESHPIHLCSQLSIPKECWEETLEIILQQHGIHCTSLSPFVKVLSKKDGESPGLSFMTHRREDLLGAMNHERVGLVLNPPAHAVQAARDFLVRFSDPGTDILQIGKSVLLVGRAQGILEVIKLYDCVSEEQGTQEFCLLPVQKMDLGELTTLLQLVYPGSVPQGTDGGSKQENGLRILPLKVSHRGIFIWGTKENIEEVRRLVQGLEAQIANPEQKRILWYTCKNSDPEELAATLQRVYDGLIQTMSQRNATVSGDTEIIQIQQEADISTFQPLQVPLVVNPQPSIPLPPGGSCAPPCSSQFVVDAKTGSIIMVVREGLLDQMRNLAERLDVPKRMVQIDVLLFEKKIKDEMRFGLNLLKLGSSASGSQKSSLCWDAQPNKDLGILDLIFSRPKSAAFPAFDLAYNFITSQEDIQINANPSITTVNRTPASISLVDEISIKTAVVNPNGKNPTESLSRAQYGITIQLLPTIHFDEERPGCGHGEITLETNIFFDTPKSRLSETPTVARRHIQNVVRIPDGQTIILGGLRRKLLDDGQESIPFLGEVPGLGKLFGSTKLEEDSTEMFIFLTPRIIRHPSEDLQKIIEEEMALRPGDCPEFLDCLLQARQEEKGRIFQRSFKVLSDPSCTSRGFCGQD